jgi:glycosyltransferase involved in cell wall biosynthesis
MIAGDGPEREPLLRLAADRDIDRRVILPGSVPGIARYFGTFRLLCHTSRREGLPNVLLEAAAHGIPAVATRAGGVAEIIDDGVTGYLADCDDEAAIGTALDRLLGDPALAAAVGSAARRKAAEAFPVTAMIAGITRMYEDALAGTL